MHCSPRVMCAGESIPIRLFLSGFELTPTLKDVAKKFSVRYFLNLVLIDEEVRRRAVSVCHARQDRRYFKQQEITLWRKGPSKDKKAAVESDAFKKL